MNLSETGLSLIFVGGRECWQGLLELAKGLPVLPRQAQLVASQQLAQLVLLDQPHHLGTRVEILKIECYLPQNGRICPPQAES